MESLANYVGALFTSEGRQLGDLVLRWLLLYAGVLLLLHTVAGRILRSRINRLERNAKRAMKEGRYEDALRACANVLHILDIVEPLYRFPVQAKYCYEQLGDAFFALGRFQSALYCYQKRLFSEIAVTTPTGHETPSLFFKDFEFNEAQYPLLRRMGTAALRCGCVHEAIIWIERCIAIHPTDAEMLRALEEAYEQARGRGHGL